MERIKLLNRKEVANILGVCTRTIRNWEQVGRLACVKVSPRCIRYRSQDVEKLVNEMHYLKRA